MTLKPDLLEKANGAGARLNEAERQALLARAEYHTAVRRLHLSGGSLREIAQSLALSHQRVQQIVRGAGGSWWSRVWRTRRMPADAVCTWCGRPPSEVEQLVAGPAVYICNACVAAAEGLAAGARPPAGPFQQLKTKAASTCAFCRKRPHLDRSLVTGRAGAICTACLRVCRDIMAGTPT